MLGQLDRVETSDQDYGASREDVFRRATFHWAQSTKRMVESSLALGMSARVAHAALADIEHARTMLDKLFVPPATKAPAQLSDNDKTVTAKAVQESVSGMVARIIAFPTPYDPPHPVGVYHNQVIAPPELGQWVYTSKHETKPHDAGDLNGPVWPKDGKMLWAGVDCPTCHVKAGQRCQTHSDGKPRPKPHESRKRIAEQVSNS